VCHVPPEQAGDLEREGEAGGGTAHASQVAKASGRTSAIAASRIA
jgi:hypothetical protein